MGRYIQMSPTFASDLIVTLNLFCRHHAIDSYRKANVSKRY
jgi:hypothetical protein